MKKTNKKNKNGLIKRRLNLSSRKVKLIAVVIIFALMGGVYLTIQSFAAIESPGADVLADSYIASKDIEKDQSVFNGRLYKNGEMLCAINPDAPETELLKYKKVTLPAEIKNQLIKEASDGELKASPELDTENKEIPPNTPSVTTYSKKNTATQRTDSSRKNSSKKDKSINLQKLINNQCKKPGEEYIPNEIKFAVKHVANTKEATVNWPSALPALKTEQQIIESRLQLIASTMNIKNKSSREIKEYLLTNNLYSEDQLRMYSETTISNNQAKQLYGLAGSKSIFYVRYNGSIYEITVAVDVPSAPPSKKNTALNVRNLGFKQNDNETKKSKSLKDRLLPKVEAGGQISGPYKSPSRSFNIRVLVTDENRAAPPDLRIYASMAQFMQFYFPGQAKGRAPNIASIDYYVTQPGTKASYFCGPGGLANCDADKALRMTYTQPLLNFSNIHTLLVIPVIDSGPCGIAGLRGNNMVLLDRVVTDRCGRRTASSLATIVSHEFMHNLGFDHKNVAQTLMAPNVQPNADIFANPLNSEHRYYLNVDAKYDYALRKKVIPAYDCPVFFGVAYAEVRNGSTGDCVKMLQWRLNNLNNGQTYSLPENGIFDSATDKAVKNMQAKKRYPQTGVVDLWTWIYINAEST
jgi:hypothetical protein